MITKGARILVEELIRHGVTTVFGFPGGAVLDIYDELYKCSDRIDHIITAHEQGASHAADGYARVTGKTGVVIATSGPGATNLVTGIANAYLDSVPMVAITGNVAESMLGKDSFQEVDIVGITLPIVKHSYIARDVCELENIITEAFEIAQSGRKGPVLIDIPKSTQQAMCEYAGSAEIKKRKKKKPYDIKEALELIKESKRPYIYCGGGAIASNMGNKIVELSQKIDAPIGLSMMGLTAVPGSYELNMGMTGMHGRLASIIAQAEADLLIGIGVRFSDRATGNVDEYRKNCKIIHIDIDEAEFGKNIPGIVELCGDAGEIVADLIANLPKLDHSSWTGKLVKQKSIDDTPRKPGGFVPRNIIRMVNNFVKPDTVVATDVGQHQMWTMQHYRFRVPRTLLTSGGLGTMGYGLGAAIGGCVANNRRRTILFTGDGSFGMNLNELATAVSQKLPILIVLFNNNTLGMVRQWQNMFYESRYSSTTLNRGTDFEKLAKAFGADGARVTSMEELTDVLDGGLPKDGPFLLECMIDIDELVLPMIPAGGSFKDLVVD